MIQAIITHEIATMLRQNSNWRILATIQLLLGIILTCLLSHANAESFNNLEHPGFSEQILHPLLAWYNLVFILLIPQLATLAINHERTRDTLINYNFSLVTSFDFIVAKFLAYQLALGCALGLVVLNTILLSLYYPIDYGQFMTGLLGTYLFQSAALAIAIACSINAKTNLSSYFSSLFAILACIMIEWIAAFVPELQTKLEVFGLLHGLKYFLDGNINGFYLGYYLALCYLSIYFASFGLKLREAHVKTY